MNPSPSAGDNRKSMVLPAKTKMEKEKEDPNNDKQRRSIGAGPASTLAMAAVLPAPQKTAPSNLFKQEHRSFGALGKNIYVTYLKAVGCRWTSTYLMTLSLAYGFLAANDNWLARWMQRTQDGEADDLLECSIYAVFSILHATMMFLLCWVSGWAGAHASQHLHRMCMSHILRAPLSWYEATPSGRTVSRMSSDLAAVDLKLPHMFDHMSQMTVVLSYLLLTICVMVPWMIIFVVVMFPLYFFLDVIVNRSSREVKRITNNAMSPILTLVQEAAQSRLLLRVTDSCNIAFG